MGFPLYNLVGTSIPIEVGCEGPKSIVGTVPNKGKYQHYDAVFHTSVLEEDHKYRNI